MTPSNSIKIIVICGPTGVGKTGFAISLARQFGGEIIGADSMQIYRWMDIGTAKPTAQEQAQAVHHMVDVVAPDENFDAVVYAGQADKCIKLLAATAKVPIVVGGTGLYIKALVHGLTQTAPTDPVVRDKLQKELEWKSVQAVGMVIGLLLILLMGLERQRDVKKLLRQY